MVGQRTSLLLQRNEEIFPEWTRQTMIYQRKGVSSGTYKDIFPRAWGVIIPCLTEGRAALRVLLKQRHVPRGFIKA